MSEHKLPPLPERFGRIDKAPREYTNEYGTRIFGAIPSLGTDIFTADQMQVYAHLAIQRFIDAFEAEQLRILHLDPRERGMQAAYSRTMGVMYEVREFSKKYAAASKGGQA